MTLTLDDTIIRSDQAAAEPLHDERIILDLNSGEYFGTGNVGAFIWDQLAEPQQLGDLARSIAEKFDVDQQQAGTDLLEFVGQLVQRGLANTVESK